MVSESLRDSLLKKVVRPELRATVLLPTTGTVRRVFPDLNKLDIIIRAPWTGSEVLLRRVPMAITPGMANPLPKVSDTVSVAFQGSTLQSAVVIGQVDDTFASAGRENRSHEGKGAFLPDTL